MPKNAFFLNLVPKMLQKQVLMMFSVELDHIKSFLDCMEVVG